MSEALYPAAMIRSINTPFFSGVHSPFSPTSFLVLFFLGLRVEGIFRSLAFLDEEGGGVISGFEVVGPC
jgi:hypothetical protein